MERAKLELQASPQAPNNHEQLLWERELLGLYLSQHPLEIFADYLSEQCIPIKELLPEHDGKLVCIGGSIIDVREIMTKNGKKMAFVKLEDKSAELEVILFPNALQQTTGLWERDKIVLIRGRVNAKDRDGNPSSEVKVMVDDAREITVQQASGYQATGRKQKVPKPAARAKVAMPGPGARDATETSKQRLYIRLASSQDQQKLVSLKETLDLHRGSTEVVLVLGSDTNRQAIKLPSGIDQESEAMPRLRELVGADNIRLH